MDVVFVGWHLHRNIAQLPGHDPSDPAEDTKREDDCNDATENTSDAEPLKNVNHGGKQKGQYHGQGQWDKEAAAKIQCGDDRESR